ncbi:serine hydrolase [Erythrobacter sp. HL-111]|uniref:serine hydrolase n=1 Tax=Erythrobacter sp. HL-111 TaxID=1798193 RepID=UPI0006DB2CD2|nr:serine hydrolase [Erythrobacter sp. HL-111]KPP86400.1 MAG: Beta-lactamase class A [Erythrobacteraceae bacterium HL-111]SDR93671.1 Beta-lactamase class A [Erythrobacter sp. HL-111]
MIRPAMLARSLFAATALFALEPPAAAQETAPPEAEAERSALETRADEVVGVINGDIPPEDVFSDSFFADVPPERFRAISRQLTGQFGAAIAVEAIEPATGTRAAIAIRMERALAKGSIAIDPAAENRVSELLLREFGPVDDSIEKIRADLSALPGEVGVYFGPVAGGTPVLAMDERQPLAIGSAFKLYVLAALSLEIAEGRRSWDDVIELSQRSFPSGTLQDWPAGAPLTLHTLAGLMMSISDNTATDQLIALLGRGRVAQVMRESGHAAPGLNTPFLKTREMSLLKGGDPARLAAYRAGGPEERRAILAGLEGEEIELERLAQVFGGDPVALDVEWFASAEDLRALLRFMLDRGDPRWFETTAINRGIPAALADKWQRVGYKGGSEPGVLNLTWLLQDEAGEWHVLALTWNDAQAPVDQNALTLIAQRIIALGR